MKLKITGTIKVEKNEDGMANALDTLRSMYYGPMFYMFKVVAISADEQNLSFTGVWESVEGWYEGNEIDDLIQKLEIFYNGFQDARVDVDSF